MFDITLQIVEIDKQRILSTNCFCYKVLAEYGLKQIHIMVQHKNAISFFKKSFKNSNTVK